MSQGSLRAFAFVLVVFGTLIMLLGIVFLLAPGRAAKGLLLLAIGGGVVGFAVQRLKTLATTTPDYLDEQLTNLAAAANGEVTVAAAVGQLRLDQATAEAALQRLVSHGLAKVEMRENIATFVFAGLKPAVMVKKCPYCGNEYPISLEGRTCPACKGNLEIRPQS
jgi:hypothetical protein